MQKQQAQVAKEQTKEAFHYHTFHAHFDIAASFLMRHIDGNWDSVVACDQHSGEHFVLKGEKIPICFECRDELYAQYVEYYEGADWNMEVFPFGVPRMLSDKYEFNKAIYDYVKSEIKCYEHFTGEKIHFPLTLGK